MKLKPNEPHEGNSTLEIGWRPLKTRIRPIRTSKPWSFRLNGSLGLASFAVVVVRWRCDCQDDDDNNNMRPTQDITVPFADKKNGTSNALLDAEISHTTYYLTVKPTGRQH